MLQIREFFRADCEKYRLEKRCHFRRKELGWMENAPTQMMHIIAAVLLDIVARVSMMATNRVPYGNGRREFGIGSHVCYLLC